ncbi:hypothetical protein KHM83_06160 [Fusibacter paucivorans]|uniref:Uncharacterized protein n=1 Tax=Fusibacter paucivorans TaxID=76009 RepID=A0ABS5PM50_9FIRM|nr:hypothetical protein [Fusibacter paucivorans]MBS7526254.1 hypothetical protein [Fusibacter paucivorans]
MMQEAVNRMTIAAFKDQFMVTKAYPNGDAWDAIAKKPLVIHTPYGTFTPRFKREESRQKFSKSISFHQSGALKSIVPQEQTSVMTPIGMYPAELVTFHKNGMVYRVFPLNGQIDGFWTEADEAKLAEAYDFDLQIGTFTAKIISIQFYDNGALKGVLLWPGEVIEIMTPQGLMPCRIGFNLYPDGSLKSFEPAKPVSIQSVIGVISAFDYEALGIHADSNAVVFSQEGELISVLTPLTTIVASQGGQIRRIAPRTTVNPVDGESLMVVAIKIEFDTETVKINGERFSRNETMLKTHTMTVLGASSKSAEKVIFNIT